MKTKTKEVTAYRVSERLNKYGVEVKFNKEWMPVFESVNGRNKPLIFKTRKKALDRIEVLKVKNPIKS